jgi:hypothetical protein
MQSYEDKEDVIWRSKGKKEIVICSSVAEYLTFVASTGGSDESFEMRYGKPYWSKQRPRSSSDQQAAERTSTKTESKFSSKYG